MNTFKLHHLVLSIALSLGATNVMAEEASQLDQFHANLGMTCTDCHGATQREAVTSQQCRECHDVNDLAEATAVKPSVTDTNPHDHRHNGTATSCDSCHHVHKPSENACGSCHLRFDLVVP